VASAATNLHLQTVAVEFVRHVERSAQSESTTNPESGDLDILP